MPAFAPRSRGTRHRQRGQPSSEVRLTPPLESRDVPSVAPFLGRPSWPLDAVQRDFLQAVASKFEHGIYHWELVPECLCGSRSATQIADRDRFGIPIGVVVCRDCGLLRTTPRLAACDLGAFYRDDYHGLHFGVPSPQPNATLFRGGQGSRIYHIVRDALPAGELRVAEVGAGTGQVLRGFERAAVDDGRTAMAFGCDLSAAYAQAGRSVGTLIEQGGPSSLAAHAPFDVVILSHVVEHFADPVRELLSIREMLSADGVAYIEVPGVFAIHRSRGYAYNLGDYLTLAHLYHFTLESLTAVAGMAGYSIVRGDQDACAVFRPGTVQRPPQAVLADEVIRYLRQVQRSPRLRLKRGMMAARRAALSAARMVLGRHRYERVKAALRSGEGEP